MAMKLPAIDLNVNMKAPWALDPNSGRSLTPAFMQAFPGMITKQFAGFGGQAGQALGSLFGAAGGPGAAIAGGQLGNLAGSGLGQMAAGALGTSFGGAAAAVAPVLAPLAAAAVAAGVAIKGFTATVEHFIERGKELAPFSASLSGARARADVRSTLGDVREAQSLGEGIGRMTEAQSRLEDTVREIVLPIKEFVVENLADLLETIADIAKDVGPEVKLNLQIILGALQILVDVATGRWAKAQEDYNKTMAKIEKTLNKQAGGGDERIDLLGRLLGGLTAGGNADAPADPMHTAAQQQLASPVFGAL